jgi:transcriptional regulator with XRE-family HTH domain
MSTHNPHPADIHTGQKIRIARHAAGLSQEALAKKLGIAFQQVQKYEKGTNRVAVSRLAEIARILNRFPAWFFEDKANGGGAPETDLITRMIATRAGADLAAAFMAIENVDVQAIVVRIAQLLARETTSS